MHTDDQMTTYFPVFQLPAFQAVHFKLYIPHLYKARFLYVRTVSMQLRKFYAVTITDLRSYGAHKAVKKDVTKVA